MCIFSGHVEDVNSTNIFARVSGNVEYLAYSMNVAAEMDVAMILPIPAVLPDKTNLINNIGSSGYTLSKDGIIFLDLSDYPELFKDLESPFQVTTREFDNLSFSASKGVLAVEQVGDYICTFVPTNNDWDRIDPQFKLSNDTWAKLNYQENYSFVVVQLNIIEKFPKMNVLGKSNRVKPSARVEKKKFHPIAFIFETQFPNWIYFPTTHVHDGQVHDREEFNHNFYFQSLEIKKPHEAGFEKSGSTAGAFVNIAKAKGLVEPNQLILKSTMNGTFPNLDTWVIPAEY